MATSSHSQEPRPARWPALLAYVIAWLAVGAIVAAVAIALLRGRDDHVVLPPVQQTELATAADKAGCRLRRGGQHGSARPRVEGPPGTPARAGAYRTAQPDARLIAAMRRGAVVIHYRPQVGERELAHLVELQRALPRGTILVPQQEMPYRLAATAWRRLLGCGRLTRHAVDAIRLFRGRYVGQGPDGAR